MKGFLQTEKKEECFGCEACAQCCPVSAIIMQEDEEGFRYPKVDDAKCISCGKCVKICPCYDLPKPFKEEKLAFGGYHTDISVKAESTSGGAFTAIVDGWCDENYVIFGAIAKELKVYHGFITDKTELYKFRKSKYSQSNIGDSFKQVKSFLKDGKKVLFSGTPCQIAGLRNYLGNTDIQALLTVEVICEGVPTPHFMQRYAEYIKKKHGADIEFLDYRHKNMRKKSGKWDFEVMNTVLKNGKSFKKDRWFNPFWSVWLNHLMSRPGCYNCKFTNTDRVADISLGDLWGVHLYCPELYGRNGGASLIVCNSKKGKEALEAAKPYLFGHELSFETALKYQSPMRTSISYNPNREQFMQDVKNLDYRSLSKKWAKKPTLKLLWSKYAWGNRQKVFMWNLTHSKKRGK